MTNEQIRENIKAAYIETKRMSLEGDFDCYYSAYISSNGAIYYGRGISAEIIPARVKEGKDKRVFLAKYPGYFLPTDLKERNDFIIRFASSEQKQGLSKYMEDNPDKFIENEELEKFTWIVFNAQTAVDKATDFCIDNIIEKFEAELEDNYGSEIDGIIEWLNKKTSES